MAVSSIKFCWAKFSARIRDYIDVVDSFYRPNDGSDTNLHFKDRHNHRKSQSDARRYHSSKASSKNSNQHSQSNRHRHHHCHHHNCTDQHHQVKISKSQLPPNFSKRKTSEGQVYFVDHNGQKFWYDPSVPKELLAASLDLDLLVGRLSETWEIRQTASGKTYFVNHTKKTTQFTDPRLVAYKDHLMAVLRHLPRPSTTQQSQLASASVGLNISNSENVNANCSTGRYFRNSSNDETNTVSQSNSPNLNSDSKHQARHNKCGPTLTTSNCHSCPRHSQAQVGILLENHCNGARVNLNDDRLQRREQLLGPAPSGSSARRLNCSGTLNRHNIPQRHHQAVLLRGSHQNLSTTNQSNSNAGLSFPWLEQAKRSISNQRRQTSSKCNSNTTIINSTNINNHHIDSGSTTNVCQPIDAGQQRVVIPQNLYSTIYGSVHNLFSNCGNNHDIHQPHILRNNRELSDKISILRQELLKQQVISHPCRIDITRKRIFEESFRVISQMQPRDLKKRLLVKFRGEEGLDYGGVAREWFYLLSREILNPIHGLFQYTSDDIYNLQINPDSGIVYREHLSYMNFAGRVIGMAVFHGHFIEAHFTLPFYKMLLRKPITLNDIEFVDPDLYRSLCWILENDITNVIDTTFLVQHNAFGQLQEHELKENGKNIAVTEENKHEYVSLYVNYRCRRGISSQFEALQRGFYELISPPLLHNFDEYELELLIGGLTKIDIEDWRLHTKLKNCTIESPLVRWFWDIVRSYDEDKRARLLQFVTGSPRVPIQGFRALQGVNSELRLFTIHMIKNACTDNLPKSHTCFNRIDLPPYETYEKLRDKLTQAIEETMGFAIQ